MTSSEPLEIAPSSIDEAVTRAARRIAPLWPLRHFVASNPYLGLTDLPVEDAAERLAEVAGGRMTMDRAFYRDAVAEGRILDEDLEAALAGAGSSLDLAALRRAAEAPGPNLAHRVLPTVADVARAHTGVDWTALVVDRISTWAGGYFDQGQGLWPSPFRDLPAYRAWHAEAAVDRVPETLGVARFRTIVADLPDEPGEMVHVAVARLRLGAPTLERFFHRSLMSVGGWAAYARYLDYQAELAGEGGDHAARDLLAVRLAWDVALLESLADRGVRGAWQEARPLADARALRDELEVERVLHAAYERAAQRRLVHGLEGGRPAGSAATARPRVQAAFCIDVRSEPLRRAIEETSGDVATLGFAGFFGVPMAYVRLGERTGGAQCPALLAPAYEVGEAGPDAATTDRVRAARTWRAAIERTWKAFKLEAVACFGFVETYGPLYLGRLVSDALGLSRPTAGPLPPDRELAPSLDPHPDGAPGIPAADRVDLAEGILRGMSLTEGLARLVVLAGHGSTTVNNPYASGLDCGACGGHPGFANAQAAAAILNDDDVRRALPARGLDVPTDTVFVAGLHDTTTDEVAILGDVPASHREDLADLEAVLAKAASVARRRRAPSLRLTADDRGEQEVFGRSRDWAQVRPEWGLAGCEALVVAPRERTASVDLGGRVFLHSYRWQRDEGFQVLELIMTAPMVVASWINLQYFGSTVEPTAFGSGNKTLHNVVGGLGVLEGHGGDLRTGLPWQSVSDGVSIVHEPLRLTAVIEAPEEASEGVLQRREEARTLVDHGWLHLMRIDESGRVHRRARGAARWTPVGAGPRSLAA
ncbi:MAG: YbcC family protein [Sandaracinaceae bacterium]